jgi:hypothetical protein
VVLVSEIDEFQGDRRVTDDKLIPWMGDRSAIWIHADDNAKREHRKLILAHAVRTLWVYRPKGTMSSREQLRALSYVLEDFLDRLRAQPRKRHYALRIHGAQNRTRVQLQASEL